MCKKTCNTDSNIHERPELGFLFNLLCISRREDLKKEQNMNMQKLVNGQSFQIVSVNWQSVQSVT